MKGIRTLYAGLDAGGSKTLVAVHSNTDAPQSTRYTEGPGVNLKRDGIAQSIIRLHSTLTQAIGKPAPLTQVVIYAGVSGAGREADQAALEQGLMGALSPQASVTVVTDADLALLAAHGQQSGILCIVGTGSIVMARTKKGTVVRAGGWGRLIGDEAGGYRIGQAALAAIANALDGGPATRLVEDLATANQITSPDELINFAYAPESQLQHTAPLVFAAAEQGDQVAIQLVDQQLALLTDRLTWLFSRHPDVDRRVAFVGGLIKNAWFSNCLTNHILRRYPDMVFVKPDISPADAALQAAMEPIPGLPKGS